MPPGEVAKPESRERALKIAKMTLAGEYDPLLACRELSDLMLSLGKIPDDIQETFTTIASETDGTLVGPERKYWPARVVAQKDVISEKYRLQVRDTVIGALRVLVDVLCAQPDDNDA